MKNWTYDKEHNEWRTKRKRGKFFIIFKERKGYTLGFTENGVVYAPLAINIKRLKDVKQIAEFY